MVRIDPRDPGGHSGKLDPANVAPHYTGFEQSTNGNAPKKRGTGWRLTPLWLGLGLLAVGAAVAGLLLFNGDALRVSGSLSASEVAAQDRAQASGELQTGAIERLVVEDGEVVRGPTLLSYQKGDVIRLWVDSDRADVITLSGFDVSQSVEAGGRATFEVAANVGGVHGIVLDGGEQIAVLRVRS